jgi:hypothetical protein
MPTSDALPLCTPRSRQAIHLAADRRHATNERSAADRAVAVVRPVLEQLARHAAQIVPKSFGLIVTAVASRVTRTANTANIRATNVHSQAFPFSSLVGVSSAFT